MPLDSNEYRCAACQQVYAKEISDDEAMAETQLHWPGIDQQDCVVLCDDCWQKIRVTLYNKVMAVFGVSAQELGDPDNSNRLNHGSQEELYRSRYLSGGKE